MSVPAPAPHPAFEGGRLPVLRTPRLALRGPEERDVQALFAVFGDPQVTRYTTRPALADLDAARDFLAFIHHGLAAQEAWTWGVCRADEDRLLGTVTLFDLQPPQRRAEVGYIFGRASWGHGYAVEAMTALVDFAFHTLGLRRLEADADPRNKGSLRVLERLGFAREGLLRERWMIGGEAQDTAIHGLLARTWRGSGTGAGG